MAKGCPLTVLYRKRDANVPLVRHGTFTLIVYHKFWICEVFEQKKNGWIIYQPLERRDFMENVIPSHKDESSTSLLFNYNIYLRFVKHLFTILKIVRLIVHLRVLVV